MDPFAALLALQEIDKFLEKEVAAMDVHKKDTDIKPFHSNLAPCYGRLKDGSSLKRMDDELKIIITVTTLSMSKLVEAAQASGRLPGWDAIVAEMQSNPVLEPMGDVINRSDKLIKKDTNYFKFDGSPSKAVVEEVHSWFVALIRDEDVVRDTRIDMDTVGAVVATTGAMVVNFLTLFYKHILKEFEVLDISVLRYPDIDHPYFKLYRIQLTAWADCRRILFVQEDANGITGVFTCRKYRPRASVLADISQKVKKQAVEEVENILAALLSRP